MSRWLVFDSPTADATQHPGRTVELQSDGSVPTALQDAVQQQRPVVLVVPAGQDRATVARITPPDNTRS